MKKTSMERQTRSKWLFGLSVLLLLCLVVSVVLVLPKRARAEEAEVVKVDSGYKAGDPEFWTGDLAAAGWNDLGKAKTDDTAYEKSIGYKEDKGNKKVTIASAAALAYFARKTNDSYGITDTSDPHYYDHWFRDYTVELECDIDLQNHLWIPIAWDNRTSSSDNNSMTERYFFAGKFDGKGHKIYNFSSGGLLNAITYDATKKPGEELRLTVDGVNTNITDRFRKGEEYNYGFIGVAFNSEIKNLDFVNVHFNLPIYKPTGYSKDLINDCIGTAVSFAVGDFKADKVNVGTKDGSDSFLNVEAAGGLVGKHFGGIRGGGEQELPYGRLKFDYSQHGDRLGKFEMTNCNNYVDIDEERPNASKGGLVSMTQTAESVIFENCNNYGTIKAIMVGGFCGDIRSDEGGMVGYKKESYKKDTADTYNYLDEIPFVLKFINCNNYGHIIATKYGDHGAAGFCPNASLIASGNKANHSSYRQIENCNNYGKVEGDTCIVAGIFGKMQTSSNFGKDTTIVKNVYNYGDILCNTVTVPEGKNQLGPAAIFVDTTAAALIYNSDDYNGYREANHLHYPSTYTISKVGNAGVVQEMVGGKIKDTGRLIGGLSAPSDSGCVKPDGSKIGQPDRKQYPDAFKTVVNGGGNGSRFVGGESNGSHPYIPLYHYYGASALEGEMDKTAVSFKDGKFSYADIYKYLETYYNESSIEGKQTSIPVVKEIDLIIDNGVLKGVRDEFIESQKIIIQGKDLQDTWDTRGGYPTDYGSLAYYQPYKIVVPASVTSIEKGAFLGQQGLIDVAFASGSTLTDIGDFAFASTKIGSIDLPASVKKIGIGAFAGVGRNLEYVNIPDTVTEIGKAAFVNNKIKQVNINDTGIISDAVLFDSTALIIVNDRAAYDSLKTEPAVANNSITYVVNINYTANGSVVKSEKALFNQSYALQKSDSGLWVSTRSFASGLDDEYTGYIWYTDDMLVSGDGDIGMVNMTTLLTSASGDAITLAGKSTAGAGSDLTFLDKTVEFDEGKSYTVNDLNSLLPAVSSKVTSDMTVTIVKGKDEGVNVIHDAGIYTIHISVPNTVDPSNPYLYTVTVTVTPKKVSVESVTNWVIVSISGSEASASMRSGDIYLYEYDEAYGKSGKFPSRTVLSVSEIDELKLKKDSPSVTYAQYVRYRAGEVVIALDKNVAFTAGEYTGNSGTDEGVYSASVTITATPNYTLVGETSVTKEWFIVGEDNYLVGLNGDYDIRDCEYGSTSLNAVSLPNLAFGTLSDDTTVTLTLAGIKEPIANKTVGAIKLLAGGFNYYVNSTMPVGAYTLVFQVPAGSYTVLDDDGVTELEMWYKALNVTVEFNVLNGTIGSNAVTTIGGLFEEGIVTEAGTVATLPGGLNAALTDAMRGQERQGVWAAAAYNDLYDSALSISYNMANAHNAIYTPGIPAQSIPGSYVVYYDLAAKNYFPLKDSGDRTAYHFTVTVRSAVEIPVIEDVVYTGFKVLPEVESSLLYTVSWTAGDSYVNMGEHTVSFTLNTPEYYYWSDNSGVAVTGVTFYIVGLGTGSEVYTIESEFNYSSPALNAVPLPVLSHGDVEEENYGEEGDNVTLRLLLGSTEIASSFTRAEWGYYVNSSMPAGTYTLVVSASVNGDSNLGITNSYTFTVVPAEIALSTENAKTSYDWLFNAENKDGFFAPFESYISAEGTVTLVEPARSGYWAKEEANGYYGTYSVEYNFSQMGTDDYVPAENLTMRDLIGVGEYIVYFNVKAPNHKHLISLAENRQVYRFTVVVYTYVNLPTVRDVIFSGRNVAPVIIDNKAEGDTNEYYSTAFDNYSNIGRYSVTFTLYDTAHYRWADGTEGAVKSIPFYVVGIVDGDGVEYQLNHGIAFASEQAIFDSFIPMPQVSAYEVKSEDYGSNNDGVTLSLYRGVGSERVQIGGAPFKRDDWSYYINSTMPAGTYALEIHVNDLGTFGLQLATEVTFEVTPRNIVFNREGAEEGYEWLYDGENKASFFAPFEGFIHKEGTIELTSITPRGYWATAVETYYGDYTVTYNFAEMGTDEYLATNHTTVTDAITYGVTYTVYFEVTAPNHKNLTALAENRQVYRFTVVVYRYVDVPVVDDVVYTGNRVIPVLEDSNLYSIGWTAGDDYIELGEHEAVFTIYDGVHYRWADSKITGNLASVPFHIVGIGVGTRNYVMEERFSFASTALDRIVLPTLSYGDVLKLNYGKEGDTMKLTLRLADTVIKEEFDRAQWSYYINSSMPAGTYTLTVSANIGGDENRAIVENYTFTVNPASLTLSDASKKVVANDWLYNGTDKSGFFSEFDKFISENPVQMTTIETYKGYWDTVKSRYFGDYTITYNFSAIGTDEYFATDSTKLFGAILPGNNATYTVYYEITAPNHKSLTVSTPGKTRFDYNFTVVVYQLIDINELASEIKEHYAYTGSNIGIKISTTDPRYSVITGNNTSAGSHSVSFEIFDGTHYRWSESTNSRITISGKRAVVTFYINAYVKKFEGNTFILYADAVTDSMYGTAVGFGAPELLYENAAITVALYPAGSTEAIFSGVPASEWSSYFTETLPAGSYVLEVASESVVGVNRFEFTVHKKPIILNPENGEPLTEEAKAVQAFTEQLNINNPSLKLVLGASENAGLLSADLLAQIDEFERALKENFFKKEQAAARTVQEETLNVKVMYSTDYINYYEAAEFNALFKASTVGKYTVYYNVVIENYGSLIDSDFENRTKYQFVVVVKTSMTAPVVVPSVGYTGSTVRPEIQDNEHYVINWNNSAYVAGGTGYSVTLTFVEDYSDLLTWAVTSDSAYANATVSVDGRSITYTFSITAAVNGWTQVPNIISWTYGNYNDGDNRIYAVPVYIDRGEEVLFAISTDREGGNVISGLDRITVDANGKIKDESGAIARILNGLNSGTYYLNVRLPATGNYQELRESGYSFTVAQVENDWKTSLGVTTWIAGRVNEIVYEEGSSPFPVTVEAYYGKATVTIIDATKLDEDGNNVEYYSGENGTEELLSVLNGLAVGRYIITASVAGTNNYTALQSEMVFFEVFKAPGLPWWGTLSIAVGALLIAALVIFILWKKGVFTILTHRLHVAISTRISVESTIASVRAQKKKEESDRLRAEAAKRERLEAMKKAREEEAALPPEERAKLLEERAQKQAERAEKARVRAEASMQRAEKMRKQAQGEQPNPEEEAVEETENPEEEAVEETNVPAEQVAPEAAEEVETAEFTEQSIEESKEESQPQEPTEEAQKNKTETEE